MVSVPIERDNQADAADDELLPSEWLSAQLSDQKPHSRDALLFAGALLGYAERDLTRAAIRLDVRAEPALYCLPHGRCGRMVLWYLAPGETASALGGCAQKGGALV